MKKILEMKKNVDILRPVCWQEDEEEFSVSHCDRCDNCEACAAWQALQSFLREPIIIKMDGNSREIEGRNLAKAVQKIKGNDFLAAWIAEEL